MKVEIVWANGGDTKQRFFTLYSIPHYFSHCYFLVYPQCDDKNIKQMIYFI